jgi:Ras-related protein Rab-24
MSKIDVKVVLLGREWVGKSCLMERFLYGKYQADSLAVSPVNGQTVGAAFGAKKLIVQNGNTNTGVALGIWVKPSNCRIRLGRKGLRP